MSESGNARRCRKYRERLKAKDLRPITRMVPAYNHEELRRLVKTLLGGSRR
jgi:hypothetical protein